MRTLVLVSLLLSVYVQWHFSSAAEAPDAVLDIAGKKLRAGTTYYILPVTQGKGGGLTIQRTGKKSCPLNVVQDVNDVPGIPASFTPVNIKKGVIRVSTDLNIDFPYTYTMCPQSNAWKLDDYDRWTGQYFVTTGGVIGNPGRQTLKNWFKIEKFGKGYKIMYCPSVCTYCRAMCRDVGIFMQNGKRRLALSDVPLKVMFKEG